MTNENESDDLRKSIYNLTWLSDWNKHNFWRIILFCFDKSFVSGKFIHLCVHGDFCLVISSSGKIWNHENSYLFHLLQLVIPIAWGEPHHLSQLDSFIVLIHECTNLKSRGNRSEFVICNFGLLDFMYDSLLHENFLDQVLTRSKN